MDGRHFDALTRRLTEARVSRAEALRGLAGGALAAMSVGALTVYDTQGKKKSRKKPVCLCPTAEAASCSEKKAKKKQARKLATQACNYKGTCQPGVVGAQCPPTTTTTPPPTTTTTTTTTPPPCPDLRPVPGHADGTQGLQTAIDATAEGGALVLCAGTWALTSTVTIGKNLTLVGAGVGQSILSGDGNGDGAGDVRVLRIDAGKTVRVEALTITKGATTEFAGGIRNGGALTLVKVTVTDNFAAGSAGGIFNNGTLTLDEESWVTGNTAGTVGGGIYNEEGTLVLKAGSRVTAGNAAWRGGGIYTYQGMVTLEGPTATLPASSVTRNTATNNGGGIYSDGATVKLNEGAIVCGNTPNDCAGDSVSGICPFPASPATCPA